MNSEVFEALGLLERERGIPVDFMVDRIKKAIVTACKNSYGNEDTIINMEPGKGAFEVFLRKTVVEELTDPGREILLEKAREIDPAAAVDSIVNVPLNTKEFGRIAAQTARNIIRQGIRDGERGQMMQEFQSKHQELVSALVERIDPRTGAATLKIGKAEAVLPKNEQVGNEELKEGDHIKVYVADVRETEKGPRAMISRTHPDLVKRLFETEVPEIYDGTVEIKAVSRDVRAMTDENGRRIEAAGPSVPVEITGLDDVPAGGDIMNAVSDERLARELVEQRRTQQKEEMFNSQTKVTLDNLFDQMQQGEMKELQIIVKADVQGSVEAVRQSLEKLSNEEVRVKVIHGGVGAINESDVMLANASNAIIVGFNVRPEPLAEDNAKRSGVDMRLYRIIYDCIEEMESAMKGMLAPKFREVLLGRAECRQVYKITNVGMVVGGHVTSGKITRSAEIRVVRDGIVIAEDKMASLKRFKDDAKEVAEGYDCGITLEKFSDVKEGDVLEAFIMEEYKED